jgi:hypothetical protein
MWGTKDLPTYGLGALLLIESINQSNPNSTAKFCVFINNVPRTTCHKVTDGEQSYSSTLSLTSALYCGGLSTPRPGRFTPMKETRCPFYSRLCGPQVRPGRVRKFSPPPGFESRTVQPVAHSYTDWAVPAHTFINALTNEFSFLLLKNFSFLYPFFPLKLKRDEIFTPNNEGYFKTGYRKSYLQIYMSQMIREISSGVRIILATAGYSVVQICVA